MWVSQLYDTARCFTATAKERRDDGTRAEAATIKLYGDTIEYYKAKELYTSTYLERNPR
jgi:hypothetical protein